MTRMIFEDFKLLWNNVKLTFVCQKRFHPAVSDHPFIDKIIDLKEFKKEEYIVSYNISRTCFERENLTAPFIKDHRSDIWADTCGIKLTKHEMNFIVSPEEKKRATEIISDNTILIAPITAMESKNLTPQQICPVAEKLKDFDVFYLHDKDLPEYGKTLKNLSIREMIAVVDRAKLVISADTAAFHLAGGLKKPLIAIFGWADGKVYGKYYKTMNLIQRHRDEIENWCGPCFKFDVCPKCPMNVLRKPCISEIKAEEILEKVKCFLEK